MVPLLPVSLACYRVTSLDVLRALEAMVPMPARRVLELRDPFPEPEMGWPSGSSGQMTVTRKQRSKCFHYRRHRGVFGG